LVIIFLLRDWSSSATADVKWTETNIQDTNKVETLPTPSETPWPSDEKKDILEVTPQKESYEAIHILVPPHVPWEQLQLLRKRIFKERNVNANIQLANTRNAYQELVEQELLDPTFDMILTPSNRIDSFDDRWLTIDFKQPITPLFHESFKKLINRSEATYIPFSIDPYITLISNNNQLPKHINIGHIQDTIRRNKIPLYLPFVISETWINNNMYPGYTDIVRHFFNDARIQWHTYALKYLINNEDLQKWNISSQVKDYVKENKKCISFLHMCLFAYDHSEIVFWKLSDLEILEQYFDIQLSNIDYTISNLPVWKKDYPYLARWRIINKESDHLLEVWEWLKWYLQEWENTSLLLQKHTFSAFTSIYNEQRLQTRYQSLLSYPNNIRIETWTIRDMQEMIENTNLPLVLDDEYDVNIYVSWLRNQ
jgi:hypothetical protein